MHPANIRERWRGRPPAPGSMVLDIGPPTDTNGEHHPLNSIPSGREINYGSALHVQYTTTGTPAPSMAGRFGHSTRFASGNYYRNVTATGYYSTNWTIAGWVYTTQSPNGVNSQGVLYRGSNIAQSMGMYIDVAGKATAQFTTANSTYKTTTGNTVLNINQWYFLVATYNGSQLTIFVDGAQDGQTAQGGTPQNIAGIGIGTYGASSTADPFVGSLYDIRVVERALTATEITELYQTYFVPDNTQVWSFLPWDLNQTLTSSLVTDDDTFYQPTVVSTGTLTSSLVTDDDTFYQPTVVSTVTLTSSLVTDTDTFYSAIVDQPGLLPSYLIDTDVFYQPTITTGAITLTASFITDTDEFYQPTITVGAINLVVSLVTDTDTFYSPTVLARYTLTPSFVTDTDIFYEPTVTPINYLLPVLVDSDDDFYTLVLNVYQSLRPQDAVIDQDVIYTPSVSQILQPSLITSADVIYTTAAGQVLQPPLFTDSESIYLPVVTRPSGLFPPFVIDLDVSYVPTIQRQKQQGQGGGGSGGNVPTNYKYATKITMLESGLITALSVESSSTKTIGTRMMLYADTAGSPTALTGHSNAKTSVTLGVNTYPLLVPVSVLTGQSVWATLHSDGNFNWFLNNSPAGSRFNVDLFSDGPSDPFGPTSNDNNKAPVFVIYLAAVNATLLPGFVLADDTFYAPVVTEQNTMLDVLFNDTDTAYPPTVTTAYDVLSTTVTDTETFYSPTITTAATISPPMFEDTDVFHGANFALAGADYIFSAPITDTDIFYSPAVTTNGGLFFADLFVDTNIFYEPTVTALYSLDADIVEDSDEFYELTITTEVSVSPNLYEDLEDIYLPEATLSAQPQFILPDFYTDDDLVYSCVVVRKGFRRLAFLEGTDSVTQNLEGTRTPGVDLEGEAQSDRDLTGDWRD